jgi:membrane protease YdiL (CAAX protease family)
MSKKIWAAIICGVICPPLLFIPLIYYYIYLPLKEGVIRGSRLSFYFWATSILSITAFSTLPVKNILANFFQLNNITNTQNYIIASFIFSLITIFMIFISTRNEPDQNLFLGIRKFKIDKLSIICFFLAFLPYLVLLVDHKQTFKDISHPFVYAVVFAFVNKHYLLFVFGFLTLTIITAVLEESVFRGLLLRDYYELRPTHQKILLASTAIYFGLAHARLYFIGPLILAIFINRMRIAYRNLLPGITFHALWNANVTVMTILALQNSAATIPKSSSVEEEVVKASFIWQEKNTAFGKKYFEYERPKGKDLDLFKGNFLQIISMPSVTDQNKIVLMMTMLNKPLARSTVEYAYIAEDWETRVLKKVNPGGKEIEHTFRCTKKLDVCFQVEKEFTKTILHGYYADPDIF